MAWIDDIRVLNLLLRRVTWIRFPCLYGWICQGRLQGKRFLGAAFRREVHGKKPIAAITLLAHLLHWHGNTRLDMPRTSWQAVNGGLYDKTRSWHDPAHARVSGRHKVPWCFLRCDGPSTDITKIAPFAPRHAEKQIARAEALGLSPIMATEFGGSFPVRAVVPVNRRVRVRDLEPIAIITRIIVSLLDDPRRTCDARPLRKTTFMRQKVFLSRTPRARPRRGRKSLNIRYAPAARYLRITTRSPNTRPGNCPISRATLPALAEMASGRGWQFIPPCIIAGGKTGQRVVF